MKKCNRCGADKPHAEYDKAKSSKDGLQGHCKECRRKSQRESFANSEKAKMQNRLKGQKRRARQGSDKKFTVEDWNTLVAAYGEVCMFPGCGSTEKLELDHVIPLTFFGEHHLSNVQILCQFHNRSKGWRSCADYRPYIAFGEQHIEHEVPVGTRLDVLELTDKW